MEAFKIVNCPRVVKIIVLKWKYIVKFEILLHFIRKVLY